MLMLLSPAKTLDFETPAPTTETSKPVLLREASTLAKLMKTKSEQDLAGMMKISPKLAALNHERFQTWTPARGALKQSLFAFRGDVYQGLQADTFSTQDIRFAQKHLRMLSGLYGLLKPLDLIKPYRLEMGTRLGNQRGADLYDFWQVALAKKLLEDLDSQAKPVVINLASNEYFKAVDVSALGQVQIINPVFKDTSNGRLKIISFFAKRARGAMANFVIKQRIKQPEKLKTFDTDGYQYQPDLSTETDWVFAR
ncbi:MAG: peroxide stress protein YaaA [Gammaproteobacteria bacterium]|jgi:cytoplasmic iron level regulating protein YaaA (DUF328/UPF0246 family)|nr:peroxide stress protein YaaA [Gammaproteobacteria bacterium]|tara:strand:+ start:167 stop:928 length:762 start_codon:yes stop_codon:yes gene_type:complete